MDFSARGRADASVLADRVLGARDGFLKWSQTFRVQALRFDSLAFLIPLLLTVFGPAHMPLRFYGVELRRIHLSIMYLKALFPKFKL